MTEPGRAPRPGAAIWPGPPPSARAHWDAELGGRREAQLDRRRRPDRVVNGAALDGPPESRLDAGRERARQMQPRVDARHPRWIRGLLVLGVELELPVRDAVASEEPPREESLAGHEARDEQLDRRRGGIGATPVPGLIDPQLVRPQAEPEAVSTFVGGVDSAHASVSPGSRPARGPYRPRHGSACAKWPIVGGPCGPW